MARTMAAGVYVVAPFRRPLGVLDLLATLYHAGGRGLAAPQIGEPVRIFVMDAGWKDGVPDPLVLIDPEILVRSPQTETATPVIADTISGADRLRPRKDVRRSMASKDSSGSASWTKRTASKPVPRVS